MCTDPMDVLGNEALAAGIQRFRRGGSAHHAAGEDGQRAVVQGAVAVAVQPAASRRSERGEKGGQPQGVGLLCAGMAAPLGPRPVFGFAQPIHPHPQPCPLARPRTHQPTMSEKGSILSRSPVVLPSKPVIVRAGTRASAARAAPTSGRA